MCEKIPFPFFWDSWHDCPVCNVDEYLCDCKKIPEHLLTNLRRMRQQIENIPRDDRLLDVIWRLHTIVWNLGIPYRTNVDWDSRETQIKNYNEAISAAVKKFS